MRLTSHFRKVFENEEDPFTDILGQSDVKRQLKSALLTDRHIIIVGPPGIGKTTLAKNISKLLPEIEVNECPYHCSPDHPVCPKCKGSEQPTRKIEGPERFIRIQGSPDLTVEDLLGDIDPIKAMKFGPLSMEAFTPGKIFKANNGILFFDEVNRCPEKLQNALLQVLAERNATIGSYDVSIDANFVFIGTMNPDDQSTEPLSDVFLDRFDLLYMTYPKTLDVERQIVMMRGKGLCSFPENLLNMMVQFVRSLREDKDLEKVPGVRATLGLYERAQSNAVLDKRDSVTLHDIQSATISVLSHRIRLKPSVKYLLTPKQFIEEKFEEYSERVPEIRTDEQGGSL